MIKKIRNYLLLVICAIILGGSIGAYESYKWNNQTLAEYLEVERPKVTSFESQIQRMFLKNMIIPSIPSIP